MCHGFTYDTGYTLTPAQPPAGLSYLPASPHRLTTIRQVPTLPQQDPPKGIERVRMVSITGLGTDALPRAREYQPVVHRLRLSASP